MLFCDNIHKSVFYNNYFDNLSLSEIGDNYSISRQAVSDCINQSIKALETYEEKLKVISKEKSIVDKLSVIVRECDNKQLSEKICKVIEDIRR